MNRILYKTLTQRRTSPVITISLAILGIYAGYLFWYVLEYFLADYRPDHPVIASILALVICSAVGIYQIPDQLFTNHHIKRILHYPITAGRLIFPIVIKIGSLQIGVCASLFWLGFTYQGSEVLWYFIFCCMVSWIIDCCILLVCILISIILPAKLTVYGFIILQYGSFLLLAVHSFKSLSSLLVRPVFIQGLNDMIPAGFLPYTILLLIFMLLISSIGVRLFYIRGYINTQNFYLRKRVRSVRISRIRNPYFLLEWRRVTGNKELIFFSNIKNIITVLLLYGFLSKGFAFSGPMPKYATELFLMISCCSVNTISSTAYSSDSNIKYYGFLPISSHRLFLWKTINGFLWGEMTVILFWTGLVFSRQFPPIDALLLLVYASMMNYACVWASVLIDHKIPRTVSSTNELLHGNISKLIVLFIAIAFTVWELEFSVNGGFSASLLPFAFSCSICIVGIEFCIWHFYRRIFL